jgi:hypothetical protein
MTSTDIRRGVQIYATALAVFYGKSNFICNEINELLDQPLYCPCIYSEKHYLLIKSMGCAGFPRLFVN